MKMLVTVFVAPVLLGMSLASTQCPASMTYSAQIGGCLRFVSWPRSWDDARAACKSIAENVSLAAVTTVQKHNELTKMADAAGVAAFYTSGHAVSPASPDFVWTTSMDPLTISGDPLTYTSWRPGDPDNLGGPQDCLAVMNVPGEGWIWADQFCTNQYAFFCEI